MGLDRRGWRGHSWWSSTVLGNETMGLHLDLEELKEKGRSAVNLPAFLTGI